MITTVKYSRWTSEKDDGPESQKEVIVVECHPETSSEVSNENRSEIKIIIALILLNWLALYLIIKLREKLHEVT